MLDELLGRADLKERVAELEEENERLRRRYEAEEGRRSEAVRERQDAEERVNRLEDRVAELEDRVQRAGTEETDLAFRDTADLRGDRLRSVLDRLASYETDQEGALTAMVPADAPDAVRDAFGERAALVERAAPCLALTDDAGLLSAALSPPVEPDPFARWGEEFDLDRDWFVPTGRFALALVRTDLFALGVYDGRDRRSFRGFESDVKGKHGKGGFSQRRFERLRDEQVDDHVEACRDAIADCDAERVFVVGEKSLLHEFEDLAAVTEPVDATGEPEDALGAAFADFWTTRLHLV